MMVRDEGKGRRSVSSRPNDEMRDEKQRPRLSSSFMMIWDEGKRMARFSSFMMMRDENKGAALRSAPCAVSLLFLHDEMRDEGPREIQLVDTWIEIVLKKSNWRIIN